MHCFICTDDDEFLLFINNFIKENDLYVFNVNTKKWSASILCEGDLNSNSASMLFCYLLDKHGYMQLKEVPYSYKNFIDYIRIQKVFDKADNVSAADIACSSKIDSSKGIF